MLGSTELIIILAIVLLLFGARKLPDLANSVGKSIKEFRKATNDALEDDESAPRRDDNDPTRPGRDTEL